MRTLLFSILLAAPLLMNAQVGANSSCATAMELEVFSGNVQGTLIPVDGRVFTNAIPDPATACSGNSSKTSAWYRFTATAAKHWIRTDGQGTDDSSMEVFSGACGSLTSIGCFPPNGAAPALTGLTVGTTYYLRVVLSNTSTCNANQNLCQVWIGVVSAPVNDECAGAIDLPVISGAITTWPAKEISSLGATQSQAACTGTADDDVWYRFTATTSKHMLGTTALTVAAQNNVYEWFSGSCGNLTSLACNQPMASGLTPGTQYYIRAHSSAAGTTTTMRVLADVYTPAPNDECAGALPIAVSVAGEEPQAVWTSTMHASASTVPCGPMPHDVWLTFTAPGTTVTAVYYGSGYGDFGLYSGSCGALVCVDEDTANPELTFTGLTPGATYYLKVGTSLVDRGNVKVIVFEPAPNALCATAEVLPVQSGTIDYTYGHSFHPSEKAWYKFTATATRLIMEGQILAGEETVRVKVHSDGCVAVVDVAQTIDLANSLIIPNLVPGQEYHVEVYGQWPLAFRLALRTGLPNDDCAGAIELPFGTLDDVPSITEVNNGHAANGTGGCMVSRDVWYRFTAAHTSAGFMAVGSLGGLNSAIELYEGGCGALSSLGCVSNILKSTFTGLVVGQEYHIRLSSTGGASIIPLLYRPLLIDQPVNDVPLGAIPAPEGSRFSPPAVQFTNLAATPGMAVQCAPGTSDDDMWYTFTATATEHRVIAQQRNMYFSETVLGTGFRIEVYDTLTADPAVLAAHVVACGASPQVLSGLTIGDQYLYRVYTTQSSQNDRCGFVTCFTTGDNDEANGALSLGYTDGYSIYFNTTGATQSLPGVDCQVDDTADDDIWFKFVATSAVARLAVGYASADVTIELFSGTPGNLTSIACDGNILELPTLTAGQTYYFRVYSWPGSGGVEGRLGLIPTPSLTANGSVDENCLGPVLVPNPGIEQGADCLIHLSEASAMQGYGSFLAPGWPRMQLGSSDAFHSCAPFDDQLDNPGDRQSAVGGGSVLSRSGKGMGGFIATWPQTNSNYLEYLQAPLSEPLAPGEPYLISFYVAATPGTQCVEGLGAALSVGPLVSGPYMPIEVVPDVISTEVICTSRWTNVSGVVVPTEPVDNITVGMFLSRGAANLAGNLGRYSYYFLDDVVVARINDPGCITSIGDVPPLDQDAESNGDALRIFPNPANDRVNIVADASLFGQRAVIELYDATGKQVLAEQVSSFGALQGLELPAGLKEGLYLVMVRVEGQAPKGARVVVKR